MSSIVTKLLFFIYCFAFYGSNCQIVVPIQNALDSRDIEIRKLIPSDRTYHIAAIEILWDYGSDAINPFTGIPVQEDPEASTFTEANGFNRIGAIYTKCVYRQYTDDTFTTMIERDAKWLHLGVMGPVIRGIVGNRIKIIFQNNCKEPFSMHPHGASYKKPSEGAMYEQLDISTGFKDPNWSKSVFEGGQKVLPGQQWVYIWDIRQQFNDQSGHEMTSKWWFYHSHINEPKDTNTGLIGPLIITKEGEEIDRELDPTPHDLDREFVTLFTVFDENKSWYLEDNLRRIVDPAAVGGAAMVDNYIANFNFDDPSFVESNLMHAMNGFIYNELGQYMADIKLGEKIRWYVGAMGTEVDLHTAHWHGHLVQMNDFIYHDVVQLLPAFTTEGDMITDELGEWLYHCHVNDHIEAGMLATYTVLPETCQTCIGFAEQQEKKKKKSKKNQLR